MEPSATTESGYEDFYAATVPSLRRLAAARTGSWSTADDVVQEVMSDAFRRWDRIGGYDDPAAWARRAVLNRSISRWRHRDRERRATDALAARAGMSGGAHDEPAPDRHRALDRHPLAVAARRKSCCCSGSNR